MLDKANSVEIRQLTSPTYVKDRKEGHCWNLGSRIMTIARFVSVKQLPEKLSVRQGRSFLSELESCLKADRPRVVLDCSKVRQLDSAGIHVLLCCLEEAMKRNGDVKLASIPPGAAAILELTKVSHLFETFDSTAEAVSSFHQFPKKSFQQVLGHNYSTLESLGLEDSPAEFREGTPATDAPTKTSARSWQRQIAGCLLLLLITPFSAAAIRPQQPANPNQAQTADSDRSVGKSNAEAPISAALPDSPGVVPPKSADSTQLPGLQSSPKQPQSETQDPLGTAAAPSIKTTGVAASRPAGSAIAPAKQRRARSILIKVGVLVGAGAAVGTVVALSKASPGRPSSSR